MGLIALTQFALNLRNWVSLVGPDWIAMMSRSLAVWTDLVLNWLKMESLVRANLIADLARGLWALVDAANATLTVRILSVASKDHARSVLCSERFVAQTLIAIVYAVSMDLASKGYPLVRFAM